MLDPRIYRRRLRAGPAGADRLRLLAAGPPAALRHDAGARRLRRAARDAADLDALGARLPRPAAGRATAATRRWRARLAAGFRAHGRLPGRQRRRFAGRDDRRRAHADDGRSRARSASPGRELVVVAHRDAAGRGARAELSGTAALLELARVVRGGRLRRTVTLRLDQRRQRRRRGRARPRRSRLDRRPVDAVLVLGDLGAATVHRPFVAGWSDGGGSARCALRRTRRGRACARRPGPTRAAARATTQWARLAFPVTVGEQGPLVGAGLPAALLSVSGERPPPAGDPSSTGPPAGLRPRGAARAHRARRRARRSRAGAEPRPRHAAQGRCPRGRCGCSSARCCWPRCSSAVDGFARVRRRHEPVGPWLRLDRRGGRAVRARRCAFARLLGRHRAAAGDAARARRRRARSRSTAPAAAGAGGRSRSSALLRCSCCGPPLAARWPGARRRAPTAPGAGRRAARSPGARWPRCCGSSTRTPPRCSSRRAPLAARRRARGAPAARPGVALVGVALLAAAACSSALSHRRPARARPGRLRPGAACSLRRRRPASAPLGWLLWSLVARLPASARRCSRCARAPGAPHGPPTADGSPCAARSATRARARSAARSRRCGDEARRSADRARSSPGVLVLADAAADARLAGAAQRAAARRAQHAPARASCARSSSRRPRRGRPRGAARVAGDARRRCARARRDGRALGRAAHPADRPATPSSSAGTRPPTSRKGPGLIAGTPLPGERGTRRSPGTARPTARRSATSTRCAAATRSPCDAVRDVPLRVEGSGSSTRRPRVLRRRPRPPRADRLPPAVSAARRIVVFAAQRRRTIGQRLKRALRARCRTAVGAWRTDQTMTDPLAHAACRSPPSRTASPATSTRSTPTPSPRRSSAASAPQRAGTAGRSAEAVLVAARVARRAARAERRPRPPAATTPTRAVRGRAASRRPGTRTARSPRRRSPPAPTARRRAARRPRRTPGGERQRVEVDLDRARRCAARGGAASVARPSERSIIACAPARGQRAALGQARLGAQVGAHERVGAASRGRRARQPGRRARPARR